MNIAKKIILKPQLFFSINSVFNHFQWFCERKAESTSGTNAESTNAEKPHSSFRHICWLSCLKFSLLHWPVYWRLISPVNIIFYRSSHHRCSTNKAILKISQYSQTNTCVADSACNFIKKRLQHNYFPVNIVKFLRTPTLKNICGRLLLLLRLVKMYQSRYFQLKNNSILFDWRYYGSWEVSIPISVVKAQFQYLTRNFSLRIYISVFKSQFQSSNLHFSI